MAYILIIFFNGWNCLQLAKTCDALGFVLNGLLRTYCNRHKVYLWMRLSNAPASSYTRRVGKEKFMVCQ
jgi:hypothetical protein